MWGSVVSNIVFGSHQWHAVNAYWMHCSRLTHIKVFAKLLLSSQSITLVHAWRVLDTQHSKNDNCYFKTNNKVLLAKKKLKYLRFSSAHTYNKIPISANYIFSTSLFNLCSSLASTRSFCHHSTTHLLRCCLLVELFAVIEHRCVWELKFQGWCCHYGKISHLTF